MAKAVTGYTRTQIFLHWTIAALFIFQIVAHEGMEEAWDAVREGTYTAPGAGAIAHIAAGIVILLLALWRISLIVKRGTPALPENESKAMKILAHIVQGLLYLVMLVMPISGLMAWFGGVDFGMVVHGAVKYVMLPAIILHVAGALAHKFVFKSGVMERMVRPQA
ncbi:MAG: cytochrome b/b6 domain-containing protein [Notoacmeibacter sp.]|nr:cytochrome b/b6 domain-containing protein [Notoacmeibacter sp.]MCC0032072.1 cytochrome b/b6 domain-containing protein [Brucellaceae bacterium]